MRSSLRLVVVFCALMAASTAAHADGTVRIGWLSSLTGPLSSSAIAENQGVLYAVDEINKASVLTIVIGSLDELTSPAKYPLAFRTVNTIE